MCSFGEEVRLIIVIFTIKVRKLYKLEIFLFSISEYKSCCQMKIRSTEHYKLLSWQGPPYINKVKQCETVLSFKLSLFIQS